MTRDGGDGVPATDDSILARIKAATRPEHEAVERLMPLLREDLTLDRYRDCLARFYGFFAPVERAILAGPDLGPYGIRFGERARSPLLVRDLTRLSVDPADLPECPDVPGIPGPAEAFGCLYVLEGSTLGGQVVGRHLKNLLGVDVGGGGAFFLARGDQTGPMWRSFCESLAAFSTDPDDQGRVVAAAVATFRAIRVWFGEGDGGDL